MGKRGFQAPKSTVTVMSQGGDSSARGLNGAVLRCSHLLGAWAPSIWV